MLIDSGAQPFLGNGSLRRAAQRRSCRFEPARRIGSETVAGEHFGADLYHLPFLRLGGLRPGNAPIVIGDMHVFDLWSLSDRPAVIVGIDLLAEFTEIAVDYGRSTVRFDLPEGLAAWRTAP